MGFRLVWLVVDQLRDIPDDKPASDGRLERAVNDGVMLLKSRSRIAVVSLLRVVAFEIWRRERLQTGHSKRGFEM